MERILAHIVVREFNSSHFGVEVYDLNAQYEPNELIDIQEFDSLDWAMSTAKHMYCDTYKTVSLFHLKDGEPHPFSFSTKKPKPNYHLYSLPIGFFEIYLHEWFKQRKGYQPIFDILTDVPTDLGSLGKINISVDYLKTNKHDLHLLENEFDLNSKDLLKRILNEMFQCETLEFDFCQGRQLLLIYIPVGSDISFESKTSIPDSLSKFLNI